MIYWNKGIVHKIRKLKIKARPIFVISDLNYGRNFRFYIHYISEAYFKFCKMNIQSL